MTVLQAAKGALARAPRRVRREIMSGLKRANSDGLTSDLTEAAYGVSSIEPDESGGEVNAGQEASSGLVIAGGDGPELLELGEEVLDQMPGFLEVFVKGARCLPGIPRWDHGCLAGLGQRFEHPLIGIERLVGNERLGLKLWEQRIGSSQVVRLTTGEMKPGWIAECIHQGVDLGGQPALATADRLVWPSFLGAPAAC